MRLTTKFLLLPLFSILFTQYTSSYTLSDTLPNNMPFSKKIVWGENGIARTLNLAPKTRIDELKLRHKMLQWHQKLGLLTLGLVGYQAYIGNQLQHGSYSEDKKKLHRNLGYASFSLYLTTASLSLLSPPAIKYSKNISSMKIHRYLSYIHFVGMLSMPYLGYLSAGHADTSTAEYHTKALIAHEIVGKITVSTLGLSFLVTLIP